MINDNWGLRLTAVFLFSIMASNLMAEETSIEAEYSDKIMFRLTAVPQPRHFRENGGCVGRVAFYQPDALRLSY